MDEQQQGLLHLCQLEADGWRSVGSYASGGAAPCYVALDNTATRAAVANYASGSVALLTLDRGTGRPVDEPQIWQGSGGGPVAGRQDGPHLHCALFDQGWLYAVDLGSDRIFAFDLARARTLEHPVVAFSALPGTGPRHLVLHSHLPTAYLVSELASTVSVLDRVGPCFLLRASHATQPSAFADDNLGGHLTMNRAGDRLYVSNRGHDSIAVFAIGRSGDLKLLQHAPSGGAHPRSVILLEDEGLCLVANEKGENIALMDIGPDGLLGEVRQQLAVPGAAFLFRAS
ncbi:6-phosphogluconolactonase [Sphingomonas zeicaulis]